MGYSLQWAKLRSSAHGDFYSEVQQVLNVLEVTSQNWTHERLVDFCHEHLFNGIPQEGLGRGMHRISSKA